MNLRFNTFTLSYNDNWNGWFALPAVSMFYLITVLYQLGNGFFCGVIRDVAIKPPNYYVENLDLFAFWRNGSLEQYIIVLMCQNKRGYYFHRHDHIIWVAWIIVTMKSVSTAGYWRLPNVYDRATTVTNARLGAPSAAGNVYVAPTPTIPMARPDQISKITAKITPTSNLIKKPRRLVSRIP